MCMYLRVLDLKSSLKVPHDHHHGSSYPVHKYTYFNWALTVIIYIYMDGVGLYVTGDLNRQVMRGMIVCHT